MLIRSLSLTNVRSYEQLSLQFPPGYILFKGDIGSGKSTILMAIEFALFGLGSLKADSIISKKAKRCEVVLWFEVDGKEYEVGRAINRKDGRATQDPESSYISHDGVSEPLTPSDLKARVLEILNFHEPPNPRAVSRVYRYAVYTPQEEIKSILEDRGDREESIRKAFGMEDYKVAAENAGLTVAQLNRERDKLSGLFNQLADNTSRLEEVRKEGVGLSEDIVRLSEERAVLNEKSKALDSKIAAGSDRMAVLDRAQAELDRVRLDALRQGGNRARYETTLKKDRDLMASTDRSIKECRRVTRPTDKTEEEIDGLLAEALETDRKTHTTKSQLEQRAAELDVLRAGLKGTLPGEAREAAEQMEKTIAANTISLQEADGLAVVLAGRAGEKTNEIRTLENGVKAASSLGARCEYCDSVLDGKHAAKLADERRAKLKAAKGELATIDRDRRQAEGRAEKLRRSLDDGRTVLPKLRKEAEGVETASKLESDVAGLRADLDRLEKANAATAEDTFPAVAGESAHEYLARLRDALAKHGAAAERESILAKQATGLEDRIGENEKNVQECKLEEGRLKAESARLAAELTDRPALEEELRGLRAGMDDIRAGLLAVEGDISAKRALSQKLEEDENRLQTEIDEAKKHMGTHKKYGDHAEWLREYFVPSLRETEREVMNSLRADFNGFYAGWYTELVDDPTKRSYIDERFGPVIEQDGFQQEFSYLSGGEKTSVSLAYRLALNSTMRRQTDTLKSNLLILDEPTDGFSKSQLVKVRGILASLEAEQVIMVSHEEELEGYVDHVYGVSKVEGVSGVAKVR